jgi:uncharacterized ferritin-like protein (DUF455 family)
MLLDAIYAALVETDPVAKCRLVSALQSTVNEPDGAVWQTLASAPRAAAHSETNAEAHRAVPGIPAEPQLVAPQEVPFRKIPNGAAVSEHDRKQALSVAIHAVAHIEFNAINLALDAAWRFANMPADYYRDFVHIAIEEALHFQLLSDHLATFGTHYGAFVAHNGLWDMAERTKHDVLHRMALVPRLLEARGLDATPRLLPKLLAAGDSEGATILQRILADEVGHVQIGNHWYNYLCEQRGVDPYQTMVDLWHEYSAPPAYPPLNDAARLQAGFTPEDLTFLRSYRR